MKRFNMTDSNAPVMITGATGYVAGWIVKKLLDEGHTVHAPVRDPDNAEKLAHLNEMAASAPGSIRYFKADLLEEGSYDEAMAGCEVVLHTASPFTTKVKDAQKELIDPALKGTQNVLDAANRIDSVKRVVLTSSCAAIYGDNVDVTEAPGGILTEDVWNTSSSLDYNPYYYSKTVAEKKAWDMAQAQDRWKLVVINPSLVIGPGTNPHATSESFDIVKTLVSGEMKMGAPLVGMGTVDVRDVAEAHYQAAFKPDAQGRHILSSSNTHLLELAEVLQDKYSHYPLPKRQLPKFLPWLLGPATGFSRKFISRNFGYRWQADNSKAKRELGLKFRPLKQSMEEMMAQLIESGQVKQRAA